VCRRLGELGVVDVPVLEMARHINDPEFAEATAHKLIELML
jgi:hypothetical protein